MRPGTRNASLVQIIAVNKSFHDIRLLPAWSSLPDRIANRVRKNQLPPRQRNDDSPRPERITTSRAALAWILIRSNFMLPIPGPSHAAQLRQIGSLPRCCRVFDLTSRRYSR